MELKNHYGDSDTAKEIYTELASGDKGTEQDKIYDTLQHGTGELADKITPSGKKCTRCTLLNSVLFGLLIIAVSVSLYMSINVSKASNSKVDLLKLVTTLSQKIDKLEHTQGQIQTEFLQNWTNRLNETNVSVGFAVSYPDTSSGSPLKFRDVIYNTGDDYNVSSGVFTCRHPGLYFFTSTLIRTPDIFLSACKFYVNDIEKLTVFSGTDDNGAQPSGSASLVYRLKAGDIVMLSGCIGQEFLLGLSSFTGFRVSY